MRRRDLLLSAPALQVTLPSPNLDSYGGLSKLKFKASGWFRLDHAAGRDLFVTPSGRGYVALGVNHANALEKGAHRDELPARLRSWSMNNLGYGGPPELESSIPYFAAITTAATEKHRSDPRPGQRESYLFPDVFDPKWKAETEKLIAAACARHRDNRHLVGYFWTDTPTWDLVRTRALRSTDWVSEIRRLPPDAPGRRRYAAFLSDRYAARAADLNSLYALSVTQMEELASADLSRVAIGRHAVREDDERFLAIVAGEYYETVGRAQRKHDPDHLILGERYLAGDHLESVLQAAAPYIDAVSVQPGDQYTELYPPSTVFPEAEINTLHRITGKPVLICDHAISYPTAEHPKTIFEQAASETEAARLSQSFLQEAMTKPFILGYLRCQYIDRPAAFGRGLRQGLVTASGAPRKILVETYSRGFAEWLRLIAATR
jgi:hypothetical protein